MAKKQGKKKGDKDTCALFTVLQNGAIKIARCLPSPTEPYAKARIPDYLKQVDHELAIEDKKAYEKALAKQELKLNELVRMLAEQKKSLIVVFQGRDGAGKSGATVRIIEALGYDMKIFQGVPIGPPSDEEKQRPFLWRFTRSDRLPAYGQVRVFDRSWAERVLVEPVMELTPPEDVQASYADINTFEWQLERGGAIIVKFWLDITKDEQWKRFEDRKKEKAWKLSPSDMVARKHWGEYTDAANEMFFRTGTEYAPWYLVSSEDKRYSRVTVLECINNELRLALGLNKNGKPSKKKSKK